MSARAHYDETLGVFRIVPRVQGRDGAWYISCEQVHAFLDEYLAGELCADERREFERHVERCDSCAAYLETYRATIELARGAELPIPLEPARIPGDLVSAILMARA